MITTITESLTYEISTCGECGISWGMPQNYLTTKRDEGGTFYCPNGHTRMFREPTVIRLEKELAAKETALRAQKCETLRQQQLRDEADKEIKRQQRRAKHGVCPCCKRTFKSLMAHIKNQHPEYGPKQERKLP